MSCTLPPGSKKISYIFVEVKPCCHPKPLEGGDVSMVNILIFMYLLCKISRVLVLGVVFV
jgi:hypothetical protein